MGIELQDSEQPKSSHLTSPVQSGDLPPATAKSAAGYVFNGYRIPERMAGSLQRRIEHGVEPGSFLMAVLENNLGEAVGRADAENLANLPAYVGYLYNEAPAGCWGSRQKVQQWAEHLAARNARMEAA